MRKTVVTAVISFLVVIAGGTASAEKTIWIDDKGGVHSEVKEEEKKGPAVELYVTSWCPYCKQAIQHLRSRGISFAVYDIERDQEAARRKSRLDDRKGVPFAVINGQKIHGFSAAAYDRALGARP